MDTKAKRGPVGKLALWAFYAFCAYFVWAMVRYWWIVGRIQSVPGASIDGEWGSTAGKWIGALLGFLVLGAVGLILVAIAWYTRPPIQVHEQRD
ncbi:cell division protein DrpB [Klebsiella aerogenes]